MLKRELLFLSFATCLFFSCSQQSDGSAATNTSTHTQQTSPVSEPRSELPAPVSARKTKARPEAKASLATEHPTSAEKQATALAPKLAPPLTASPLLPNTDSPKQAALEPAQAKAEIPQETQKDGAASSSSAASSPEAPQTTTRAQTTEAPPIPVAPAAASSQSSASAAAKVVELTPVLSGEMKINFGTRKDVDEKGEPIPGALDRYEVNFTLLDKTIVKGSITRRPRLVGGVLGREIQSGELKYELRFTDKNENGLMKMTGSIPVDANGTLDLRQGALKVESGTGKQLAFSGRIIGKNKAGAEGISGKLIEYTRIFQKKKITLKVKNVDPLNFENVHIPAFGNGMPEALVSGSFDYDYDTGNWLSNGFRFRYSEDGEKKVDQISGSVHWVEDPSRDYNGKGYYDLNLRYNEQSKDESAFFAESLDEGQFFAPADDIPSLLGRINYRDTFGSTQTAEGEKPVLASNITYDVRANQLSAAQVSNFFRLWLLIVGPVNDE